MKVESDILLILGKVINEENNMFHPQRILLLIPILVVLLPLLAFGQGNTSRYVYDNNGRLRAVIVPSGEASIYDYDAAGNFTGIRQVNGNYLELFDFYPKVGVPGDRITFIGVGFGAGVSSVAFTGAQSQNFTFNSTTVRATVPVGTITGPVTLTTANGVVTTAVPFTLGGVAINPGSAILGTGESVVFTATVFSNDPNQSVVWSVNGFVGGNLTVGTITVSGIYTAPAQPIIAVIRATSVANPSLFGEAQATVLSQDLKKFGVSAGVSVRKELTLLPETNPSVGISKGVSISKELTLLTESNPSVGISKGVSISKETTLLTETNPLVGISKGVSISKELTLLTESNPLVGISQGVSVTNGPYITLITPNQLTRGSSVSITITGINLTGATAIQFASGSGFDSNITASNIIVNGAGTSLTATINVGSTATLGQKVVIITTPIGRSLGIGLNINSVTIQ